MEEKQIRPESDFGVYHDERPIRRITFKSLLNDIANTFNFEKGILYTLKELILHPGSSIKAYLTTGRFNYMNPLKLLILTTALAVFFTSFLNVFETESENVMSKSFFSGLEKGYNSAGTGKKEVLEKLTNFDYKQLFYENLNILLFMALPITALFSYLLLSKKKYNYAENLALNAFIISVQNLVYVLFVIEMEIVFSNIWVGLFVLLSYGYLIYVYIDFFKLETLGGIIKMFLAIFLSNIVATILNLGYFILLIVYYFKM